MYAGAVPVVDSVVVRYFDGENVDDPVVEAVAALLGHADGVRRMGVRANADTPEDATRARRFGAGGIGLCRTEHMFLGDRRVLVENLVLADDEDGRDAALAEMLPRQREDFVEILAAMDGLPVTIRLIDPPLHEFLPDLTSLSVRVERGGRTGRGRRPATTGCWRPCARCTSRTRCSASAAFAWAWSFPGWWRCRRVRCSRRPRTGSTPAVIPGRRSWSLWSRRLPSWRTYGVVSSRWPPRSRRSAGSPYRTASGR